MDLSKFMPDEENGINWSSCIITDRQQWFNDWVLGFFQECSSKAQVAEHLLHCTGGVFFLDLETPSEMPLVKVLSQRACPWTFYFQRRKVKFSCSQLYESVKFLDFLYVSGSEFY